jgi:hypothetical protein
MSANVVLAGLYLLVGIATRGIRREIEIDVDCETNDQPLWRRLLFYPIIGAESAAVALVVPADLGQAGVFMAICLILIPHGGAVLGYVLGRGIDKVRDISEGSNGNTAERDWEKRVREYKRDFGYTGESIYGADDSVGGVGEDTEA